MWSRTRSRARGASRTLVDQELNSLTTALDVLAVSRALLAENLQSFHALLEDVRRREGLGVVLRDLTGQQLVNARMPFGSPLPKSLLPGEINAAENERTFVSDMFVGVVSQEPQFVITVPIAIDGRLKYLLSASLPTQRISDILAYENPGKEANTAVIDRSDKILARSSRTAEFVGRTASADLLANTGGQEGSWVGGTIDGRVIFGSYARTRLTGWRVVVGMPQQVLEAPLWRSLLVFATVGLGLAGVSLIFASFYARRIIVPFEHLTGNAEALGRGEPVAPLQSNIREARLIGAALADASTELRKREDELREFNIGLEHQVDERTAELVEVNRRLVAEAEQRERVEEQLRQAQKMEAVGQLTGGIAHDFNNLLAIVTGNLDLMLRRLRDKRGDVERFAENALEAANRGAMLTHRLLAFSRQQPLMPEQIDVNKLVGGMSDLIHRSLGEGIEIETVLAGGLWRTHADNNQLENALLNLAVNARDAMPDGGRLTIETANAHIDERYAAEHQLRLGQYVLIAVTDTGTGMTLGTIGRAFEPFFTTKEPGKGTGLGLSQVYGFVRQSGGHVKIYSEPNQGTTVKIYLPRFFGPAEANAAIAAVEPVPTGQETILLVEDEERVRKVNAETLRELGYTVLEAEGAATALRLLDGTPGIDLLFTDVVMPDVNGRKLADEALRRRPELKVLFTTGYTRNAVVHNGVLDPGVNLIPKPFTLQQLAQKVRDVLETVA